MVCLGELWFSLCNLMWVLASLCCGDLRFVFVFPSGSDLVILGWFVELAGFKLNLADFVTRLLISCGFSSF